MTQRATIATHMNTKLVGILRTKPGTPLKNVIQSVQIAFDCGIEAVEITSNSCHWYDVVYFCSRKGLNIGVGSVKDSMTALEAINCGANFFVSPGMFDDVLSLALKYKVKIIPGVYKETDLTKAVEIGIVDVKFFPAGSITHEELFRAIREPFRDEFEKLRDKGWVIDFFREENIHQTGCVKQSGARHCEPNARLRRAPRNDMLHGKINIPKYIVESPTEFYDLYLNVKCLPKAGQIFIKLPDGNLGFERLKSFSVRASKFEIRTYAVGGVNDKNVHEVVTKYGAYGICSGSGMFDVEAIYKGDFTKVRHDVEKYKLVLEKVVTY